MRYTEQEIENMQEYETRKRNHLDLEEQLTTRRLSLWERNELEHQLDLAAGDLEDARFEYLAQCQTAL